MFCIIVICHQAYWPNPVPGLAGALAQADRIIARLEARLAAADPWSIVPEDVAEGLGVFSLQETEVVL